MATSSKAVLPARSPIPLMVTSTCLAPLKYRPWFCGGGHAQVVVAMGSNDGFVDVADVFHQKF
jgi:hypothetical protein